MRIYISLPITGQKYELVKLKARDAKKEIIFSKHTPVSPLDLNPDPTEPYSVMMGRCIQALLECDAILLCKGWENSKGCTAEFEIARIYGKKIMID